MSARENQEVSEYERQYEDGSDPRVFDIIDIPVLEPQPKDYQTENWLLDPKYYWVKVGRASSFDLPAITDPVEPLWIDGFSTYHGRNDKIPLDADSLPTSSLRLLHAINLKLAVFKPGEAFGNAKRRVQGQFTHLGTRYALWVTDSGIRTSLSCEAGTVRIILASAISRLVLENHTKARVTN